MRALKGYGESIVHWLQALVDTAPADLSQLPAFRPKVKEQIAPATSTVLRPGQRAVVLRVYQSVDAKKRQVHGRSQIYGIAYNDLELRGLIGRFLENDPTGLRAPRLALESEAQKQLDRDIDFTQHHADAVFASLTNAVPYLTDSRHKPE